MNISEFIGFIITLVLLLVLFFRKTYEDNQRKKHPEKYAAIDRQREEAVKELLRSMNLPVEEIEVEKRIFGEKEEVVEDEVTNDSSPVAESTAPRRSVKDDFSFQTKIEDRHLRTSVGETKFVTNMDERYSTPYARRVASVDMRTSLPLDPYASQKEAPPSKAKWLLDHQSSLKDVILLQAIFSPPKALEHVQPGPPTHQ